MENRNNIEQNVVEEAIQIIDMEPVVEVTTHKSKSLVGWIVGGIAAAGLAGVAMWKNRDKFIDKLNETRVRKLNKTGKYIVKEIPIDELVNKNESVKNTNE